jgi:methionyl-tRNA synthetase
VNIVNNLVIPTSLEIIRKISYMLYPIIPQSALNALKIFEIGEIDINFSTLDNHNYLKGNNKINKIDILFKKIDTKDD